ncbi:MAG: hypothetical protein AAF456_21670, partial [Planctomycetota bacterium]
MESPGRSRLVSFLYNQNPFYLISAGIVLYGLNSSLTSGGDEVIGHWLLASIISSYAALLALTAFLIVKFGGVWDDARSIFMVILLLFFALSVSFDSLCITDARLAVKMLASGFCFSVVVTELLLSGLAIRIPARFKAPLYLMLAVSFFYPLTMSVRDQLMPGLDSRWILAFFPVVVAGAILSLIPAARAGSAFNRFNGTPWSWPMFPWSLFILMAIGLCGRGWLLTQAFDPTSGSRTIFASWFFIPVLFATLYVLLEVAIVEKIPQLRIAVFAFAALLPFLGGQLFSYKSTGGFEHLLTSSIASPIWAGLFLAGVIYAAAAFRNQRGAMTLLVMTLAIGLVQRSDGSLA